MKQVYKINNLSEYVEPVLLSEGDEIPSDCVEEVPTEGLFKAKWNGTSWVEGLTQSEIDAIKNSPVEKTQLEQLQEVVDQLLIDSLMGV